jgi:glycogen debranching enzyme
MDEVIKVKDDYYILASSSVADEQSRILKNGETFAIFDRHGDMRPFGFEDHGIFHEGTRFLSRMRLTLNQRSPLLLSSFVKQENDLLVVDLTNTDLPKPEGGFIPRGTLYIVRTFFISQGHCYQRLSVANYGLEKACVFIGLEFEADYLDIFEVRGIQRAHRGQIQTPTLSGETVTLAYTGLDQVVRRTQVTFSEKPFELKTGSALFYFELDPLSKKHVNCVFSCLTGETPAETLSFESAHENSLRDYENYRHQICHMRASNEQFNGWIKQSRADLHMLVTQTPQGLYPFAGIPWFSTYFGRDGIITALQMLWMAPDIAKGVLGYLALRQATESDPAKDSEPGKILHEERKGEMAALKEIPFGQYYGTIDATPLFIILAGYYYERTGDLAFMEHLWPHVERALMWIDQYGDINGDGFIEYARKTDRGLTNQGWKDSEDSVFHADGRLADGPIALCEVQGYVFEAKMKASAMALALGKKRLAVTLKKQAALLKENFLRDYWCEEIGMYAIALDGERKPCRVRSSNAGQCLFSGIASEEHAKIMVRQFLDPKFFTGWGIRTLASTEPRYNPMSYHNGSIWPHDNSMIAYGMARYGYKEAALKVLTGLFEASLFMDLQRMPELFCGFERRPGEGPTLYPVACDPQAWAAASVFMMLQACLGLSIQTPENQIWFHKPVLPDFLNELLIKNLKVGENILDLSFQRDDQDVSINLKKKDGGIEIVTIK